MSDIKYSIILPFRFNGDRWPLFDATIKNLHKLVNSHSDIEIVVFEPSEKRYLTDEYINQYNINYRYKEDKNKFHRSWTLNVAARHLAKGAFYIFMDGDLIVTQAWLNEVKQCKPNTHYAGYTRIYKLNQKGTNIYLKDNKLTKNYVNGKRRVRSVSTGTVSGINVFHRKMFNRIKGWPENYKGLGWGAQDNSMNSKCHKLLGKKFTYFKNVDIYHLFHKHRTGNKDWKKMSSIYRQHSRMNKNQWENEIKRVGDSWGNIS